MSSSGTRNEDGSDDLSETVPMAGGSQSNKSEESEREDEQVPYGPYIQKEQKELEEEGKEESEDSDVEPMQEVTTVAKKTPVNGTTPGNQYSGYLDYSIKAHADIYKLAILPLSTKLYDLSPAGLLNFVKNVRDRAEVNGWNDGCLLIISIAIGRKVQQNLLDNYASMMIGKIQKRERKSLSLPNCRAGQDSNMLFQCLMASITAEAQERVRMYIKDYTVDGKRSDVCLFKVITRCGSANHNTTVTNLCTQLQKLDVWVIKNGDNVISLNQYVREMLARLATYGQMSLDTVPNLFRGYEPIKNKEFRQYINWKKEIYGEGKSGMTPNALMVMAETKYTGLVQLDQWEQSTEDKQIVALTAQVKKLTKQVKDKHCGNNQPKKSASKPKGEAKSDDRKPKAKPDPDWLKKHTAPTSDRLNKPKPHNGKVWWWCSAVTGGKCDGRWRVHEPKDCKGMMKRASKSPNKPAKKAKTSAMAATLQAESDSK